MDLQQFLKYRLSSTYMHDLPSPYSGWPFGPTKFSLPDTPTSNQFDSDTSVLSYSQDQYSSTDTMSWLSTSPFSPLEIDSTMRTSQLSLHENLKVESNSFNVVMRNALHEIETVLMSPDTDVSTTKHEFEDEKTRLTKQRSRKWSHETTMDSPLHGQPSQLSGIYSSPSSDVRQVKRLREMTEGPSGNVKQLIVRCAEALSENSIEEFKFLVEEARGIVSISGDPIQRVGAYILEGLVAKHEFSGTKIYRALRCREPESKELLSYMRILYDICPYFKFGYMAANGAIAEALRNEDNIHIIDFQIAQGTQWITLIQAMAARPGGPPRIRITGIDDPVSKFARGDGLQPVGKMLSEMSKEFKIPLEFQALNVYGPQVTREMLDIRPGEALAVNFTLQLHNTPDESVDVNNPRDGLLRMVRALNPKVTTLVEQESNTNTTPFLTRFMETLDYYSAMFESIDATLPRDKKDRISVEQHCLAKDIVNIIACEGNERVERHELLGKWRSRLGMAGFKPYPLSSYVNSVIRTLLGYYSDKYTLLEKDGAMLLGWKNRNLISASAWH